MRIGIVESGNVSFDSSTCLVVPVFADAESGITGCVASEDMESVASARDSGRFAAKAQDLYYLPAVSSAYAGILLMGLGDRDEFDAEVLRRAAGKACETLRAERISRVALDDSSGVALPVEAFIEGIALGQYDFRRYKEEPEDAPVDVEGIDIVAASTEIMQEVLAGCERAQLVCDNANWARDLANMPPNDLTPTVLAGHAEAMAKEVGCDCTVFDDDELEKRGMNAILCVGQGSSEPSRLAVLHYTHDEAERTLAMVGKGVTFDTGGISIKQGEGMHEMKWDMCGAAAVLGAMKSICQLKPKINVVCVVPAAENMPSADAYVPGDIIRAYSGKTVEVLNTDAEGRMLLADALAYTAETYQPDAMVDVATLTGACIVALGHYAAGVMGNDDGLLSDLELAADASGERIWPMPMWSDYRKMIESKHADVCHVGPRGDAGSITAACFLQEFVGDTPWAHLDIAGTAWGVKNVPYWTEGHASGFGVRLLTQWVLDEAQPV